MSGTFAGSQVWLLVSSEKGRDGGPRFVQECLVRVREEPFVQAGRQVALNLILRAQESSYSSRLGIREMTHGTQKKWKEHASYHFSDKKCIKEDMVMNRQITVPRFVTRFCLPALFMLSFV